MEKRTRRCGFMIRLTERELAELDKKVAKTGMSREAYVRNLIKDIKPMERPVADYFEVLKNLRQINVNMNQIAVKANASGVVDAKAYFDNVKELQSCYRLLK